MAHCITVFCASSEKIDPRFFDAAEQLGARLGQRGDTLVYGGGRIGLMGALARAVHTHGKAHGKAHGGRVVGVIPERMKRVEVAYTEADELIVTDTMRQRKQIMEDRADAIICMPGGFGTLEELLETITHRRLKFHHKPIVLLNTAGFYDHLLELFDRLYAEGFAKRKDYEIFHLAPDPDAALAALDEVLRRPTPENPPGTGTSVPVK